MGACRRHPHGAAALKAQIDTLNCVSSFQVSHPTSAFVLFKRIADLAPAGLDRMFLVNSGSEAHDIVMKIALAHPLSLNTSNGPP